MLRPFPCVLSLLVLAFFTSSKAYSMALDPKEIRGKSTKNPVSVLQNRYFVKSLRPEVGIMAGSFLNEAYTDTASTGFRISLFLTEWLGVEGQSVSNVVRDSDDRKALNKLRYRKVDTEEIVTPDPEVNPIYGSSDITAVFAPFYGKLNFMDFMILYSDLYFTAGISKVDTSQGDLNAAVLGLGQRFYFAKSVSFRVDFKDRIFSEERSGSKAVKHAYSVDFGISYFFF